jgi:hypothetical protein
MELLEGKALRDSIAHRPLATDQLPELASEIADLVKGADIWDGLAQTPPELALKPLRAAASGFNSGGRNFRHTAAEGYIFGLIHPTYFGRGRMGSQRLRG